MTRRSIKSFTAFPPRGPFRLPARPPRGLLDFQPGLEEAVETADRDPHLRVAEVVKLSHHALHDVGVGTGTVDEEGKLEAESREDLKVAVLKAVRLKRKGAGNPMLLVLVARAHVEEKRPLLPGDTCLFHGAREKARSRLGRGRWIERSRQGQRFFASGVRSQADHGPRGHQEDSLPEATVQLFLPPACAVTERVW
jgi:hypothetical protein